MTITDFDGETCPIILVDGRVTAYEKLDIQNHPGEGLLLVLNGERLSQDSTVSFAIDGGYFFTFKGGPPSEGVSYGVNREWSFTPRQNLPVGTIHRLS